MDLQSASLTDFSATIAEGLGATGKDLDTWSGDLNFKKLLIDELYTRAGGLLGVLAGLAVVTGARGAFLERDSREASDFIE